MKKIILNLSLILLIISCNNSNDDHTENPLNGKWFMDRYIIFSPTIPDLSEAYILWDFNTTTNILTIVNYYTGDGFTYETGYYNFTYTNHQISIDNGTNIIIYDYEFDGNKLVISNHPELDGPAITFNVKENDCIDNPLEDLQWLSDITDTFDIIDTANGQQIIQYIYNGECVYQVDFCFECPDNLIGIYNTQGEVICEFGGIAGLNTCPDFYDTATDRRVLFSNIQD